MQVLVTYYTQTGNTEKVARAVYEAVGGKKEIMAVSDVKNVAGYDVIFCGFPVHAHSVPAKMAFFIERLPDGQKVAFFCTHGSLRGGPLPRQALEHAAGLAGKLKILGSFACRGKVSEKIIEALMAKPEHRAWAEEARGAVLHPDENDLADARAFAKQVMAAA